MRFVVLLVATAVGCSDERTVVSRPESSEQRPTDRAATASSPASAPEGSGSDLIHFEMQPSACPADRTCDVGECTEFKNFAGWEAKRVCVTDYPCSHVTCSGGKTCYVDETGVLQVHCGDISSPSDLHGDAGPPAMPPTP